MAEISFVGAFLGGTLSLLAPCGALLLPTFFAYAFSSKGALVQHTLLFYLGLCSLLVPLGMGASLVSDLLIGYRDTTVLVAGLLVIAFGVMEIAGRGFSFLPARFSGTFRLGSGPIASVGAGMVYGLAGFCAGPLLGGVLTVAATSGGVAIGGLLLATYALGMAAPLFALAMFWKRWQLGSRPWLRGRTFHVGSFELHTTSLLAGTLFIGLGISLIVFQGGSVLSGVYADLGIEEFSFAAQDWLAAHLSAGVELVVLTAVLLSALALWWRRNMRACADGPRRPTPDRRQAAPVVHNGAPEATAVSGTLASRDRPAD